MTGVTSIDLDLIASVAQNNQSPALMERGYGGVDGLQDAIAAGAAKHTFSESSCSSLSGVDADDETPAYRPPSSCGSGRETPVKLSSTAQQFLRSIPNLAYMLTPPGFEDAME